MARCWDSPPYFCIIFFLSAIFLAISSSKSFQISASSGLLSSKLPISRLQRDLTDSTVLRNVGVPFGHSSIAIKSTIKGINKLIVNKVKIENDLNNNWAVIAEAIQTILRREGYPNPYETLKELTRTNTVITAESIKKFIEALEVNETIKEELRKITPFNYTGVF